MTKIIFCVSLSAEVLTAIVLAITIAFPHHHLWPPERQNAWGQYFMVSLFNLAAVGVIILGIIDWGTGTIPPGVRFVGLGSWLAGNALAIWAVISMGLHTTLGNEGIFIQRGPYQFSRNPQYVGFMMGLLGWGLMTNSFLTLGVALFALIPLTIVPLAEESWLREKYGAAYNAYCLAVPRFLAWHQ